MLRALLCKFRRCDVVAEAPADFVGRREVLDFVRHSWFYT
jgi:hypothetical protein